MRQITGIVNDSSVDELSNDCLPNERQQMFRTSLMLLVIGELFDDTSESIVNNQSENSC